MSQHGNIHIHVGLHIHVHYMYTYMCYHGAYLIPVLSKTIIYVQSHANGYTRGGA